LDVRVAGQTSQTLSYPRVTFGLLEPEDNPFPGVRVGCRQHRPGIHAGELTNVSRRTRRRSVREAILFLEAAFL